jgi:ribonuclease BN (tRNA processing enzyme)
MLDGLTILGSGGFFPAHDRHTACALIRRGESAIMIDAGTGVGRLAERPELLAGVQKLDILLTHFHLDHICGLAYLPGLHPDSETTIWGPGQTLYGRPTSKLLDLIDHEPLHPVSFEELDISTRDLPAGELELDGIRIAMRGQPRHSAPSLGFRFDDALTWITDTAYDPDSARFAAGSEVLAHECWYASDSPRNADIHSSAAEAARVAANAEVERMLLIHLPPFEAGVDRLVSEARLRFAAADAAIDGAEVSTHAGTAAG